MVCSLLPNYLTTASVYSEFSALNTTSTTYIISIFYLFIDAQDQGGQALLAVAGIGGLALLAGHFLDGNKAQKNGLEGLKHQLGFDNDPQTQSSYRVPKIHTTSKPYVPAPNYAPVPEVVHHTHIHYRKTTTAKPYVKINSHTPNYTPPETAKYSATPQKTIISKPTYTASAPSLSYNLTPEPQKYIPSSPQKPKYTVNPEPENYTPVLPQKPTTPKPFSPDPRSNNPNPKQTIYSATPNYNKPTDDQIEEAFKTFDVDNNGYITKIEFSAVMKILGKQTQQG